MIIDPPIKNVDILTLWEDHALGINVRSDLAILLWFFHSQIKIQNVKPVFTVLQYRIYSCHAVGSGERGFLRW